jgi:urocanate reductase
LSAAADPAFAAAIAANQAGAKKVVVLEKMGFLGGSTNVSEGALNAVDPERQGAQGIEDSLDKFYNQTLKGGHNKGDPELVRYLTQNSLSSVKWLESLGVKFKDQIGTATGALWQRSHYPATPSGNTYIRSFEKYIAGTNGAIQVITDAHVTDLIKANGRISGAVAENFGRKVVVSANDGVVLATGGFGANVKLRQEVNTGVWKKIKLDNSIGCTNLKLAAQGEGLTLARKYGADVIGLDDIQIHPCGTPGTGLMENIRTSGRNRLFVNTDGNRFVNEGAPRDVLANAIFNQKGGTYWVVVNKVRYPSRDYVDRNGASIKNMVALGAVVEANTLDELAKKTGMNAKNLKKAVADYNKVVRGKGKVKDKFGFVADNKADTTLTEGPWYACRKVPTVHHTMGGVRINTKAQVLDTKGNVIPGLYAAGEVTGGIHGSNRLGGNAIADIMLFGRTAGTNVVKLH